MSAEMAQIIGAAVGQAVAQALDERDAQQAAQEQQAEQAGKLGRVKARIHKVTAPSTLQPPSVGGGGGDSWLRGLRARRMWGLRYLPAAGVAWYFDLFENIDPYLASAVVDPAATTGALAAFAVGPMSWWASRILRRMPYSLVFRAGLSFGSAGIAYEFWGPSAALRLYAQGIDASMFVPFGAGALVTAAQWWFLDRRTYRLPWVVGWIPLIPTCTVALATATFVIDF